MSTPRPLVRALAALVLSAGVAAVSFAAVSFAAVSFPIGQPAVVRAEKSVTSNGGRYVVHVVEPEGGFVRGKPLSLEVRVTRADEPTVTVPGLGLVVDADMPEHLHGTNRVTRVERRADGTFVVENLYLHMPGWWEVFLDVVESPWTERAQVRVELD